MIMQKTVTLFEHYVVQAFTGYSTGVMSYSFIKAVETQPRLSYGSLLSAIRSIIHEAQRGAEVSTTPVYMLH